VNFWLIRQWKKGNILFSNDFTEKYAFHQARSTLKKATDILALGNSIQFANQFRIL
jgi:hypothetical protein